MSNKQELLLIGTDKYGFVGYGDIDADAKEGTSVNLKKAFLLLEMPIPRPDGSGITRVQTLEPIVPTDDTAFDITVNNVQYILKLSEHDAMAKTYESVKAQCSGIQLMSV